MDQQKQNNWYETLFGVVALTLGLNLVSNLIYDRAKQYLDKKVHKDCQTDYVD